MKTLWPVALKETPLRGTVEEVNDGVDWKHPDWPRLSVFTRYDPFPKLLE